jgi:hypothetical protein
MSDSGWSVASTYDRVPFLPLQTEDLRPIARHHFIQLSACHHLTYRSSPQHCRVQSHTCVAVRPHWMARKADPLACGSCISIFQHKLVQGRHSLISAGGCICHRSCLITTSILQSYFPLHISTFLKRMYIVAIACRERMSFCTMDGFCWKAFECARCAGRTRSLF